MNRPLAAQNLGEFWGRRWNGAFRDLGFAAIYQPLARRVGGPTALMAVFLSSGIIHDFVISIPAGAGHGLPSLYFLIQGFAALFANSTFGRRFGFGRGSRSRMFGALVILLPLPLLFHRPFVEQVVAPFLNVVCMN